MSKPRKHYSAVEKVAILRRHLLARVPVSDLCDQYRYPAIDVLQLAETILRERGRSFWADSRRDFSIIPGKMDGQLVESGHDMDVARDL